MPISIDDEIISIGDYLEKRKKGCKGIFSTHAADIHKLLQANNLIELLRAYGNTNDHFVFLNSLNNLIITELNYEKDGLLTCVLLKMLLRLEGLVFDELVRKNDIENLHKIYKSVEERRVKHRVGRDGQSRVYLDETTKHLRDKLQNSNQPAQYRLLAEILREDSSAGIKQERFNDFFKKVNKSDAGLAKELNEIFNGNAVAMNVIRLQA